MDIDRSREMFCDFKNKHEIYKSMDLSESDTRSKVIDKLLIEVLGWNEDDIQREGHVNSGFFDYKLSIPGFFLIVEAKRQFNDLKLPLNSSKVSINTLYKENEEVITQIRNYTADSGIDCGLITNGYQFIIGQFVNHNGKPWRNNQVLIFNGFENILDRYIEFYNNLSKICIIQNGGLHFMHNEAEDKSKKIISTLLDREKEIVRNTISSNIAPFIETIFGEIFDDTDENNKEFIRECFIENRETIKNKNELNKLFDDTPPELDNVSQARNLDTLVDQISNEIIKNPILSKETTAPNPVIIVGSKGAGKTTFINYLFKNQI